MRVTASVTYDQLIREKKQHDQSDLTIPTGSVGNESFTLRMSAHFFFSSVKTLHLSSCQDRKCVILPVLASLLLSHTQFLKTKYNYFSTSNTIFLPRAQRESALLFLCATISVSYPALPVKIFPQCPPLSKLSGKKKRKCHPISTDNNPEEKAFFSFKRIQTHPCERKAKSALSQILLVDITLIKT